MASTRFVCPIEDCKHFNKVEYSARDHDRNDLYKFAFQKGIIDDPIKYHNPSYIIQQIAEISKVKYDK